MTYDSREIEISPENGVSKIRINAHTMEIEVVHARRKCIHARGRYRMISVSIPPIATAHAHQSDICSQEAREINLTSSVMIHLPNR